MPAGSCHPFNFLFCAIASGRPPSRGLFVSEGFFLTYLSWLFVLPRSSAICSETEVLRLLAGVLVWSSILISSLVHCVLLGWVYILVPQFSQLICNNGTWHVLLFQNSQPCSPRSLYLWVLCTASRSVCFRCCLGSFSNPREVMFRGPLCRRSALSALNWVLNHFFNTPVSYWR